MKRKLQITPKFNLLLVLFSAAYGIFRFALSDAAADVPLQGIILTSLLDFVRFVIVMFVTSWFAREIWNRLIADIFDVRMVAYQEAITFVVALSLFTS
ncbi:putative membrane protein [Rhodopirellula sallentina SM41]|uniref:Putative membrane protein n=1 Tax=Rhodopirellula sallentina SM41 TaxID=1263870 RepID=M5UAT0_9BACT|nr:putative membrane protein [Rhodopirellula sallentina SM41]